ncbi:uncharacterized protein LOC142350742 [Convolutriloba macropyga]|uniref:uncharacterized protein LOC142350742 n=1 Tax=Convolutriloba macropyga TaxID=536237 RepID=UPI003F526689
MNNALLFFVPFLINVVLSNNLSQESKCNAEQNALDEAKDLQMSNDVLNVLEEALNFCLVASESTTEYVVTFDDVCEGYKTNAWINKDLIENQLNMTIAEFLQKCQ